MYLFIDESGDTGCKGSSTQYFILSAIVINDILELEIIEKKLNEFIKLDNINFELHFIECHKNVRDKFFNYIKSLDFNVIAIYHKKTLATDGKHLFNKMLIEILKNLENTKIRMDGKKDKKEQELKNFLRKQNIKIKDFKMLDSKNNLLIQFADMVASAIGHSYNKNNTKWMDIIKDKIILIEYK